MTISTALPDVNIYSREFKADPYPFYARLREESPVHKVKLPMGGYSAWLVTRYDDVVAMLKDDKRFVKDYRTALTTDEIKAIGWIPPVFEPIMHHLLEVDGEQHTRLRGLIHKAFTPRMIENIRSRIDTLANDLLDQAERKGKFDLISDYALPIPLTVISEMMGVQPKDRREFYRLSKGMLDLTSKHFLWSLPTTFFMVRYLRRLIKQHRKNPSDDLTTALVEAEVDGDHLTENEIIGMLFILLIAGHETTVNLIGSGTLALMEHPEQMRKLRANADLNKSAVEELVRFVSPVEQATERYTAEEVEIAGVTIPRGNLVLAVIASANRDATVFENGDDLDITRQNNKHISFGLGVHYCVGAPLARLEGQIALQALVNRLPSLHLATQRDSLKWRTTQTVRGLEALPVAI